MNCGNCKYSHYDKEEQDFVCTNEDSENYGLPTMYNDSCEQYEDKQED